MPLDPKIIETLKGVSTATLTTVLLKKGLRNVWMRGTKPLRPGQGRVVGPAFTLRFVPAREDLATPESWASPISTRAAIEAMPEGCVAVADALGVTDAGIFGDILCSRMAKRGVAGLVTDGVMRDAEGVLGSGMKVWCDGIAAPPSVAGLTFVGWQEPISCGGVAVFPDDIVVVDDDGAVLIPGQAARRGRRRGAGTGTHGRLDHDRGRPGRAAARPLSDERQKRKPVTRPGRTRNNDFRD
jgi:regulator of RNase E activity RraA